MGQTRPLSIPRMVEGRKRDVRLKRGCDKENIGAKGSEGERISGINAFLVSLHVVCLWYFGARRRKRARGHVDRRRWLASRARQSTRWYCARHVPSEEKTSLAVGRGVAPSLVTEKAGSVLRSRSQ